MFRANNLKTFLSALLLLMQFLLPGSLDAQTSGIPSTTLTIPEGTAVTVRLGQTVSSTSAHVGDHLPFVVVKDVRVEGRTVISAGSSASGLVVDVKGKRFLGVGGEVVFSLDSVALVSGEQVALRARQVVKGSSRTKLMAAGMVGAGLLFWPVAPVFLLSRGCASTALQGTEVTGHVAADVVVQAANLPRTTQEAPELKDLMAFVPRRVLNGEGREGDMVNLLFVGQNGDLQKAFHRAGWVNVDKWWPMVAWHLLLHRTHDAQLPMVRFFMFGRSQDYAYALPDPAAIVSRRHHLRIWKTDYQIGGNPVWVGAATHDVAIEVWKRGHLLNHRIDPQVDEERDFIGSNLAATQLVGHQNYVQGTDPVFQAETASGEAYYSDSRILMLDLHQADGNRSEGPIADSLSSIELAPPPPMAIIGSSLSPAR